MENLELLAIAAYEAEADLATAERLLATGKRELARAKDALEGNVRTATQAAYDAGTIDGKNAEMRKLQLDTYLANDQAVSDGLAEVADWEAELIIREEKVAHAKANARRTARLFDIGLEQLRGSRSSTMVNIVNPAPAVQGELLSTVAEPEDWRDKVCNMTVKERQDLLVELQHDPELKATLSGNGRVVAKDADLPF